MFNKCISFYWLNGTCSFGRMEQGSHFGAGALSDKKESKVFGIIATIVTFGNIG